MFQMPTQHTNLSATSLTRQSSLTTTDCTFYSREHESDFIRTKSCFLDCPGILVEINEASMGKRKKHCGHKIKGAWFVCDVERTTEKKLLLKSLILLQVHYAI